MNISFVIDVVIGVLFVSMIFSIINQKKPELLNGKKKSSRFEKTRAANRKKDEDLLGRRFQVPRDDKETVSVNLYEIESEKPTGIVYILHGGNLLDGDADQADSFCRRMSQQWNCMIVSVNYTKLDEQKPPYQQDEIIDTVLYFSQRATFYHIDPSRCAFVGFSGGAYLMMGAVAILATKGYLVKGMIAFYPIIDDSLVQLADQHLIQTPVTFVTCENEQENQMVDTLVEHIRQAGTECDVRHYESALTGFIEVNNPEYENNKFYRNQSPALHTEEQKTYASACEIWMGGVLERYFEENGERE